MKQLLSAIVFACLATGGLPALAHSKKEGTTPADGATLSETPEMIHMVFDAPMRVTLARLLAEDGTEMPMTRDTKPAASLEFRAAPEPLAPGRYTVEWRGLASDGHAMQGSFAFEVTD